MRHGVSESSHTQIKVLKRFYRKYLWDGQGLKPWDHFGEHFNIQIR